MKYEIYTIYDNVAQIYHPPMFLQNDAVAIRNITTLKNDNTTTLGQNPDDYHLYHIASYDDQTGTIKTTTHTKINTTIKLQEVSL